MGAWVTATVTGNTLYNFTTGGMVWTLGRSATGGGATIRFFGAPAAVAWRHDSIAPNFDGWQTETGLADPGTYAGSAPTGVKIVARPNQYEPGRANIIVYNWAQQSADSVDVSGILGMGDRYVVQNARDFYGPRAPAAPTPEARSSCPWSASRPRARSASPPLTGRPLQGRPSTCSS